MKISDDIVIVAAKRTAIGSFGKSLKTVSAVDLGAHCIRASLASAGIDPAVMDEVIMGNVLTAGSGQKPARQAAIGSGIPHDKSAFTVNMVCGSGMKAVQLGFQAIRCGDANIVVVGGMENMSLAPYILKSARWGARMGHAEMADSMVQDGLWDAFNDYHMGITAENLAERYGITREEQDGFAFESQAKTRKAQEGGRFDNEIANFTVPGRKPFEFASDEFPRPDTTMETLARLRPVFKKDGTVTAGNASGINDGASALVIASRAKAEELDLPVMATIKGFTTRGCDPAIMGYGPIESTRALMERYGLSIDDFDLAESNEAFAVQSVLVLRELGLDPARVNVNGGAIALGHPIGESGSRILVTLLHEIARRKLFRGLATMCIGGGQGISAYLEREE